VKKIRGRLCYFGPWGDPEGALARYREQAADLHAGRRPQPSPGEPPEALTVKALFNAFLNHKQTLVTAGELTQGTLTQYQGVLLVAVKHFGKTTAVAALGPADFASLRAVLAARWCPPRLVNGLCYIKSAFKYGVAAGLLDRVPLYGPGFDRPSRKTLRLHRARRGEKLFTRDEIHALLAAADPTLRAIILVGVNAGFGNADIGRLPLTALDLEGGWVNFERPKTGIARRCPLWPETVAAIREAVTIRPQPYHPGHANLVFLTRRGRPWWSPANHNILAWVLGRLLRRLGINGRERLNFYALRHNFATAGDRAKDPVALSALLGHADGSMLGHYRERIDDERLVAVSDCVRAWLFGDGA
jgi:integrase